jgi:tetratricopeptide (TPR) repeat protein
MRSISKLNSGLERIDNLWRPGGFAKALALVDRLLKQWPDNPLLLVKRAQLIQLQETEEGPSLEEAKASLERAVGLDEASPAPLIELGFFLFAVEDNAKAALPCFQKAERLLAGLLRECRKGIKDVSAELVENGHVLADGVSAASPRRIRRIRQAQ